MRPRLFGATALVISAALLIVVATRFEAPNPTARAQPGARSRFEASRGSAWQSRAPHELESSDAPPPELPDGWASELKPLLSHGLWRAASERKQDDAIAAAGERLGPAFTFIGAERYAADRIAIYRRDRSGVELCLVPGGSARRPSTLIGRSRTAAMNPENLPDLLHAGPLLQPFLIARYELRRSEWDRFANPESGPGGGPDSPIAEVSWLEAKRWLQEAGDGLRLPFADEWAHAARAGSSAPFLGGDLLDDAYVWHAGNSGGRSHEVTRHANKPNAFGLIDALGNLWEWCEDRLSSPKSAGLPENMRLLRGGGFKSSALELRFASWSLEALPRERVTEAAAFAGHAQDDFGLRVARGLERSRR